MNVASQIIVTAMRGKPTSQIQLRNNTQPNKMIVSFVKQEKEMKKKAYAIWGWGGVAREKYLLWALHKSHVKPPNSPYFFVTTIFVSKSF